MRRHLVLAATATLISFTAACGAASDATSTSGEVTSGAGKTAITVGALPIGDYGAVYYAKEKGLFEKQGLDVTIKPIQGGANSVPALLNGEFDIAVVNWTSYIQAVSKRIPLRAVAAGAQGEPGFSGIVALPKSGIQSAADLKGKVIAVNNLKAIAELTTRVGLQDAGVDPASVKFTQLPLPDMPAALAKGSVDAAWVVEPFLGLTKREGAAVIIDPYAGTLEGAPVGGYATTEKTAKANPGTLTKFAAALAEASAALRDKATFQAFLPSYTGLPPKVANTMTYPASGGAITAEALATQAEYMRKYGWISKVPDLASTLDHLQKTGS